MRATTRLAVTTLLLLPAAARANVVGGDLQNFNAVPGGIDYVTVESSETLEPGYLNLGLMANYAVNSLPYYEDSAQNLVRYNDSLTMMDFGVGFGLVENVEIGFAVQDLLAQQASENANHDEFTGPGVTNYRAYGKYRLLSSDDGVGVALIGTAVFNHVKNNPLVGEGGSPVGVAEAAFDTKLVGMAMALNVGYRFRHKGQPIPGLGLEPMGNQYIGSAGLSYLLPRADAKLIAEVFGSRPAQPTSSGIEARQSSSAEALLGVKFDATHELAIHVGGGTELIKGSATPDWRVYAGLNWAIGPVYRRSSSESGRRLLRPTAVPNEERAVLHNIHFATNSDQVPDDAAVELAALAEQLKMAPFDKIVVEGHTDSVGNAAHNRQLSLRRAKAVRQWLIDHGGLDQAKIKAVGYGQTRPIASNGNFQGRQRNRRVEVLVIRKGAVMQRTKDGPVGPPAPAKR